MSNDAVSVEISSEEAQRLVARFNQLPTAVREGVRKGIAGALLVVETRVKTSTGLKWRRGAAGLAGRLTSFATLGGAMGIDAAIGFRRTRGFPYELSQEYGAKAKPGKAMAIPISPIARQMSERGQSPKDWPRGRLFRLPGTRVLVESTGPKAKPILHYFLTKSIPPRLRFIETVRANVGEIERGVLTGARRGAASI
jgi:hypothetical protein